MVYELEGCNLYSYLRFLKDLNLNDQRAVNCLH